MQFGPGVRCAHPGHTRLRAQGVHEPARLDMELGAAQHANAWPGLGLQYLRDRACTIVRAGLRTHPKIERQSMNPREGARGYRP